MKQKDQYCREIIRSIFLAELFARSSFLFSLHVAARGLVEKKKKTDL